MVPYTHVRADECDYTSRFNDTLTKDAVIGLQGSTGLPIGVQIVTLPWQDEDCIQGVYCKRALIE